MSRQQTYSELMLEGLYTADPTSSELESCKNVIVFIVV
jgi:hypothetical protein